MTDRAILLAARQRVADIKPGCARAILSDDEATNWDRGDLVRGAVAEIEAQIEAGRGE